LAEFLRRRRARPYARNLERRKRRHKMAAAEENYMKLRKCFLPCLIIAFAFLNAAAEDRQKEFKCYFFDPVEWGKAGP